jgi:hypothetical protein
MGVGRQKKKNSFLKGNFVGMQKNRLIENLEPGTIVSLNDEDWLATTEDCGIRNIMLVRGFHQLIVPWGTIVNVVREAPAMLPPKRKRKSLARSLQ